MISGSIVAADGAALNGIGGPGSNGFELFGANDANVVAGVGGFTGVNHAMGCAVAGTACGVGLPGGCGQEKIDRISEVGADLKVGVKSQLRLTRSR
jgi:threonine dehydratase